MLSIIICTYNRDKYIYQTLEHLAKCGFNRDKYEIVLVNNNCTDATEVECMRFTEKYRDVPFRYFVENNQGLSFARNRGMHEAKGEWLVFLDDDAFVAPDYLHNLSEMIYKYPDSVAFGGKIEPFYEDGIAPKWMSRWSYSWVSAIDKGTRVTLFKKDYPIGANMGISRKIANIIGDFNVALGRCGGNMMGGEEKDYFNRIKEISDKIYYFPSVAVEHCIPPKRLTKEFIRRLALGIGHSEQSRTRGISTFVYVKRCFSEFVKWCATLFLLFVYTISMTPSKGTILVLFRYNVSKGLFTTEGV